MFGKLVKNLARKYGSPRGQRGEVVPVNPILNGCRCRPAKKHRDCAYCGVGYDDGRICGRCKEDGIDGKVIPGTSRVTCSAHKS